MFAVPDNNPTWDVSTKLEPLISLSMVNEYDDEQIFTRVYEREELVVATHNLRFVSRRSILDVLTTSIFEPITTWILEERRRVCLEPCFY